MTSTDTLLPCPMCGGKANDTSHHSCDCCGKAYTGEVACFECSCSVRHYDTRAEAIAAWNRRTPPTPATEEREAVAQWCSGCHEVRSVDCYRAGCPKSDTERRAAEILAAEARGREVEAAAIMDWLCDTYDPDDEHDERLDIAQAIEVVHHIKHGAGK